MAEEKSIYKPTDDRPSTTIGPFDITLQPNGDVELRTYALKDKNILTAEQAMDLLQWLYEQQNELFQIVHPGQQPEEFTLYWHPSETYTARLAYGIDHPLWGSERLTALYEGRWVRGKVGHVIPGGGLVLWPHEKEGNPEYIVLTVGSKVRNVSEPMGDGGGPEQ